MTLSRRQQRWLVIAGALVALFTVFGFLIAPPILKSQLVKRLSAELGREVSIVKVRLNPYALSLTLEGLAIKDRDGGPFVGWQRVYVNFDASSVFVREWRFQTVTIEAPTLRVIVNKDGSFNFSDLVAKFSAPAAKPASVPEKPAWPLRIGDLAVSRAALDFADHSRSAEFATRPGPVSFTLKNFHTSPGSGAPYEFAATTEVGESLTWRGTLSAAPVGSQGEFTLRGIKLPKYAPYYRDFVQFDLTGGSLDFGGRYDFGLEGATPRATLAEGQLHLTGLKVSARGGEAPLFELDDLTVSGVNADAAKRSVAVAKIAFTGGRATAHRSPAGVIDLVAMLTPASAPAAANASPAPAVSTSAIAPPPSMKPEVKIAELALRKFALRFEDRTTPRVALNQIDNLELDANNLTLAEGAEIPFRVALALPQDGAVKVDGKVVLSPLQAEIEVEASNVAIASVSPYLEPQLNLRIAGGTVSAKGHGHVALPAGATPELSFKGDVGITRFLTVAGDANDEFASWAELALRGIDFTAEPLSLSIGEIAWTDPAVHLIVNRDGSNNLATILRPRAEDKPSAPPVSEATTSTSPRVASPAPAAPLPKIAVGKVSIANGAFTFADRSVEPGVSTAINQFGGTIAGLSSTNMAKADVDLQAMVDGIGPIVIAGKLDPLGAEKFVDLKIDFKNVDLTPFSPYTGKFAGYELARGKLFLEVTARLKGDNVDMANVVTLNQFTFGAATNSPVATKLPVRLGVALLKDTEGKMIIDIPVVGSLADPEFRIGRVVWRVIGNLLTKAATSPFSLLGAMFGGGGDELAFQEFAPGSSELAPENLAKLATLTKALGARPGLNLEIAGSFDAAADTFALKQQLLAKQLRARAWEARRAADPNVPPPEQLVVTAAEEAPLVRALFDGKFPPGTEFGAPLPVAPPPTTPSVPPKRGLLGRVVDVVTFKSRRAEKPLETKPAIVSAASTATGSGAAAPTLEEMKLRLADALPVTDDDLRQLATARAQKIREHFLQAQVAADRLFLVNEPASKGPRVLLQLQ